MRDWISCSFKQNLLSKGWLSSVASGEMEVSSFLLLQKYVQQFFFNAEWLFCKTIQMWNNIISIHFSDEKCTNIWRQTFMKDFEGMYKRVGGMPFRLPLLEV